MKKTENVPKSMKERYAEIVSISDAFCSKYLNEEYAQLIRFAIAALCRKRPSPLAKGKASTWACGVTHAIGMANFLFDKSELPCIGAADLYKAFGVGQSTGQGKSKLVRDLLKIYQLDSNWSLPSKIAGNPMTWMLTVNGMIVDVRNMPREVQEIAFQKGLIPYIPSSEEKA